MCSPSIQKYLQLNNGVNLEEAIDDDETGGCCPEGSAPARDFARMSVVPS